MLGLVRLGMIAMPATFMWVKTPPTYLTFALPSGAQIIEKLGPGPVLTDREVMVLTKWLSILLGA